MINIYVINIERNISKIDQLEDTLSKGELLKAKSFKYEKDYKRYVITHGWLRKLLAERLNCLPLDIKFQTNKFGKPALNMKNNTPHFNLSHSHNYALIGISTFYPIGIDIEFVRPIENLDDIVKSFFNQNEQNEYFQLSRSEKPKAFYRLWCFKEAYLKAIGTGLSADLSHFDVSAALRNYKIFVNYENQKVLMQPIALKDDNYFAAIGLMNNKMTSSYITYIEPVPTTKNTINAGVLR